MEPNTVTVSWATSGKADNNTVTYGPAGSASLPNTAVGDTRLLAVLTTGTRYTHVATLTNIEEGASYDYQVHEEGSNSSDVYTFTYRSQHGTAAPKGNCACARSCSDCALHWFVGVGVFVVVDGEGQ